MDEKITLLLVEDDPLACGKMAAALTSAANNFAIVGVTNSSTRAMQCIREFSPDVVVLGIRAGERSDGLNFLNELKGADLPLPYILVIADSRDENAYRLARQSGADFIMNSDAEDFSAQSVAEFLKVARAVICARRSADAKEEHASAEEIEEKRIQRRISSELDKLGISSKCIGYRYLIEAIGIIMDQPVQHVCRMIGMQHGKTENSVERAMQNAINRAWTSTDSEELAANYTARIKSSKGIPTITEFIYHYAHKLNNEF